MSEDILESGMTELTAKQILEKKTQERNEFFQERSINPIPEIGWKKMPLEFLPSKGLFYPEGTQIQIKAATVKEIRHFSTIDENDILDVDDKLNGILDACTRVIIPEYPVANWKDICDVDRIFLVYSIREMTFIHGENKLTMNIQCRECGNTDSVELTKDKLSSLTFNERLMKYYNPQIKGFTVKTKSGDVFELYIPSLGVSNWIRNWVKTKHNNQDYFDKSFIRMGAFLYSNYRNLNEKSYKALESETLSWNMKKFSVFQGVIDALIDSTETDITHSCSACGTEGKQPIKFQGGIKSLFLLSDVFDELD